MTIILYCEILLETIKSNKNKEYIFFIITRKVILFVYHHKKY